MLRRKNVRGNELVIVTIYGNKIHRSFFIWAPAFWLPYALCDWESPHAFACLPSVLTVSFLSFILEVMEKDVSAAVKAGAHGVVIGVCPVCIDGGSPFSQ